MTRRHYTDEDRATALAVVQANGGNACRSARECGIPESTLRRWIQRPDRAAPAQLRGQKRDEAADQWARVRDKALALAEATLDAFDDGPDRKMLQTYVTVSAVATEKHELLSGGATERLDHVGVPPVREVVVRKQASGEETDEVA